MHDDVRLLHEGLDKLEGKIERLEQVVEKLVEKKG